MSKDINMEELAKLVLKQEEQIKTLMSSFMALQNQVSEVISLVIKLNKKEK